MPGNGTCYSRADSRAEVKNFIWIERKPDIELVGGHINCDPKFYLSLNYPSFKIFNR